MADKTLDYLKLLRSKTGLSDYKISQKLAINQSNFSKYRSGKAALSETHAWQVAEMLNLNPALVVAQTKIEHAKLTKNKEKSKFWKRQLQHLERNKAPLDVHVGQMNSLVGDIKGNAKKIIDESVKAIEAGAHIIIFPELALTGYCPEDLLLRPSFLAEIEKYQDNILRSVPSQITVLYGVPHLKESKLYNAACVLYKGRMKHYFKRALPNYGIFDEKRYFEVGEENLIFCCQDKIIGVLICEDIWQKNLVKGLVSQGVDMIISLNASPFEVGKFEHRVDLINSYAREYVIDFLYVNSVGGQDELVFDGGSFMVNHKGKMVAQMPFFEVQYGLLPTDLLTSSQEALIYKALVLGLQDYYKKTANFEGIILGLSGGIDSSLALVLAIDALGKDVVAPYMLPSRYTSSLSTTCASEQCTLLGVELNTLDISSILEANFQTLNLGNSKRDESKINLTKENLQARIRATLLMAEANLAGKLLLATSNKSEIAMGYGTLYGDMCGGFNPLKDVDKTLVYRLAKYRNSLGAAIPKAVIKRAPSAELAPNQLDTDSLPSYDKLDSILALWVEENLSVDEITAKGYAREEIIWIIERVLANEYKRRQAPLGPKISKNAFGRDRRYPIVGTPPLV